MSGTPMVDDIELAAVQHIRQETEQGYLRQRIAGLDGTLHQRLGRRSHRVYLSGVLVGETAADDLKVLQEKASSGAEVTFTADIATALEIEKMVIESLVAEQHVGRDGQFGYALVLTENPPLPPPAETSAFGGLEDFGVGDIGFGDVGGVLDDVAGAAGELAAAADGALEAAAGLADLAGLADIGDVDNPLAPLTSQLDSLSDVGGALTDALAPLQDLL
jgi:hypothetical protein